MERYSDRAIEILNELHTERLDYNSEYLPLIEAAQRLSEYENTGMEPEEIERVLDSYGRGLTLRSDIAQKIELVKDVPADWLRELVQADKEGRCAVLSEPMKPMVRKPGDTDVYCPNCGETLSGGWMLSDTDDDRKLCQYPKCGQSIDDTKCEAAETALKGAAT